MTYIQMRKNHVNWLDDEVKQNMRRRDQLRFKARISNLDPDWQAYRKSHNLCTKLLHKKKNTFYKKNI